MDDNEKAHIRTTQALLNSIIHNVCNYYYHGNDTLIKHLKDVRDRLDCDIVAHSR